MASGLNVPVSAFAKRPCLRIIELPGLVGKPSVSVQVDPFLISKTKKSLNEQSVGDPLGVELSRCHTVTIPIPWRRKLK